MGIPVIRIGRHVADPVVAGVCPAQGKVVDGNACEGRGAVDCCVEVLLQCLRCRDACQSVVGNRRGVNLVRPLYCGDRAGVDARERVQRGCVGLQVNWVDVRQQGVKFDAGRSERAELGELQRPNLLGHPVSDACDAQVQKFLQNLLYISVSVGRVPHVCIHAE